MKTAATILVVAALFASSVANAGARADLDAFTHGLKGLQGGFAQTVYDSNGAKKEYSTGRVSLAAPRLFRWEYVKPYPQLIVADGTTVWVYDPDLKQVTRRPQGAAEGNSPLAALIDPAKLDKDYVVAEAGSDSGLEWLTLTPRDKDNASFESARLGFDDNGLNRMSFTDLLGQRTEIVFAKWVRNPAFGQGTFTYVPPKDVDVVGGEG
ncbi:MAG TPA: outer membrane lipoprotein chaperone LolA [Lysobacter sp.]|jgi:outer membrane lipoprotein carrier protein|nr:outer membrane lipoprotein chaperone LolA [Lysobacter sp.]